MSQLGKHSDQILAELGYAAAIAALHGSAAVP